MPGLKVQEAAQTPGRPRSPARTKTISLSYGAAFSLVCAFLLFSTLAALWYGRAVHLLAVGLSERLTAGEKAAVVTAEAVPQELSAAAVDLTGYLRREPEPLLIDAASLDEVHKAQRFPAPEDPGYLLLSGVSPTARQSMVSLIRISDGRELAQWRPDPQAINAAMSKGGKTRIDGLRLLATNPVLLPEGDIVYNTGQGQLVRQSPCGKTIWALDGAFHHSNELDAEGSIWGPARFENPFPDDEFINANLEDDAIARSSLDGRRTGLWSFSQILIANGLRALLFGHGSVAVLHDPIHMNDIQPALSASRYWAKGDLLISSRNLSTVFLYRPATGRIVWHKTGPWLFQHDVNFLGDSKITVFGNDVIGLGRQGPEFLESENSNQVYVYDFAADTVSTPFAALMSRQRVRTPTEGRAKVLPDGGLFIEETNYGRILRFAEDRLLWSRVNWYDRRRIGRVSWSRYLTEGQVREPLAAIALKGCGSR